MKTQMTENDMNLQDITSHSDFELSLIVFNDETLYRMRHRPRKLLRLELEALYIFTETQFDMLMLDIMEDKGEAA